MPYFNRAAREAQKIRFTPPELSDDGKSFADPPPQLFIYTPRGRVLLYDLGRSPLPGFTVNMCMWASHYVFGFHPMYLCGSPSLSSGMEHIHPWFIGDRSAKTNCISRLKASRVSSKLVVPAIESWFHFASSLVAIWPWRLSPYA